MKILVFSDSHSGLSFMRACIDAVVPDVIIHLGDHTADGEEMASEYPGIRFYQVAGNCDRWRMVNCPETLIETIAGVRFFITHGHLYGVKTYTDRLVSEAQKTGADIALYGHTHSQDCRQTENGMWVMNPGACGSFSGTAGLIEIDGQKRIACRILNDADLEEFR